MADFPSPDELFEQRNTVYDDDLLPDDPPQGYRAYPRSGPYSTRNGPQYEMKDTDGRYRRAMRIRERHCNGAGVAHGGNLMAFMDGIMGYTAWNAAGGHTLTIRMNSDFLHMAKPGDWLEGEVDVTRATKSVVFLEGRLFVGKRDVFRAKAIFKVMRARK